MAAISEIYLEVGGSRATMLNITSYQESHGVRVLGTPIESGVTKFDHRVRDPISVSIVGQADRASCGVLKSAAQKSQKASSMESAFCTVYPPDGESIKRLVITRFSQTSSADSLNLVGVNITLQEMMEG